MRLELPSSPIFISDAADRYFPQWWADTNYSGVFVLCDENTFKFCYPKVQTLLPEHTPIVIPAGEEHKHINTCAIIWKALAAHHADRKSVLINLGGGVVGDMGGFAAATYKRGMDFIQFPTSLLSQVDASVGGKLGVDLDHLKNLVGVFQDPAAVFIATTFLETLPDKQITNGFAEVLKHGLIYDAAYWDAMAEMHLSAGMPFSDIIARSVQIKSAIVEQDPKEAGLRKILNFGHTIGHAVESWSLEHDATPLLHGEAIAIGMICEARMSQQCTGLPETALEQIANVFMRHFAHYPLEKVPFEELFAIMLSDKKNIGKEIKFSLLQSIGHCVFDVPVDSGVLRDALQFYNGL